MRSRELTVDREFACRLEGGADLREEIESFAAGEGIDSAWFNATGAVSDAELWFYDRAAAEYESVAFDEPLELAACVGSVSTLSGEPFAHSRAVLSRSSGQALAGYLNAATVFSGEAYVRSFEESLVRERDGETGLDRWL